MLQAESRRARKGVVETPPASLLGRIRRLMSRKLTLFAAGLAVGCLIPLRNVELQAQGTAKKNTKPPIRPAQGTTDEVTAPRPKPRALPRNELPSASPPESSEPAEESRPTRPRAEALRVERLSPELEQILKDWEAHSSQVQKLTGVFKRHRYDHLFEVEYQSFGKFAYEMPDKGAYQFEGAKLPKDAVSQKKNADKKPYALKPDQPQHWVCNGKEVLKIDAKTYGKVSIPPENQGENIIDGPLPFLFGMKAEQAKRRYAFELLEGVGEYKDEIWLGVKPRWPKDAANWREAKVIINHVTFLPMVVKLVEPSGNADTVHIFSDVQANPKAPLIKFWEKDPFKPDLRKLQLVQDSKEAPPGVAPSLAPGTSARPSTGKAASSGTNGRTSTNDRDLPRSADSSNGATKKKPTSTRN